MNPINNTHSSLTIDENCYTTFDSPSLLIDQWKTWAAQAQSGVGEQRDVAFYRLTDCLERHNNTLTLDNLNLTELPPNLPGHIKELDVNHNQLTHLPETLPTELRKLNVSMNRLAYLPERLPNELEEIDASNNQLRLLPETLPTELRKLKVSMNRLTHLPARLPNELEELDASSNRIERLPETLPSELTELFVHNNYIVNLPETLPTELRKLNVSINFLHRLPEVLPTKLEELDVRNNYLTYISESLLTNRNINLEYINNPFSDKTSRLIKAVCWWDKNSDITLWKKIVQEDNADHFSLFLTKLHQQYNASNTQLHRIVSAWLTELAKEENKEIRAQTFAIAHLGTESCIDRASYYFNQMHSSFIEHRLTNTSVSITEIVTALRSLFRLQELEKISAEHAARRGRAAEGFAEDIEIYLAYQCMLKDELALPVHTELQFETIAELTPADLTNAKHQILEIEREEFLRHLVNHSEVWQKKIKAWNSEKWELVNERYLDEIVSPKFQQQVEEALKKEGISTVDGDATRIMQQKMASDLLFQLRYPLTEAFLKENNAFSLLNEVTANDIS